MAYCLRRSLPERRPWLWEALDSELQSLGPEEVLPQCAGFRAPYERRAAQLVAAATARALAAVEEQRARTWVAAVTEPCGLVPEAGLPPCMGLPGRAAQVAKVVVANAVSQSLAHIHRCTQEKWTGVESDCLCSARPCPGLPPAKGLPRRAEQLSADLVAAATGRALRSIAAVCADGGDPPGDDGMPCLSWRGSCAICLDAVVRPVELPCGHTFCADCLLRLVSHERSYNSRACPLCRGKLYELPAEEDMEDAYSEDLPPEDYLCFYGYFVGDWFFYCSCSKLARAVSPETLGAFPGLDFD